MTPYIHGRLMTLCMGIVHHNAIQKVSCFDWLYSIIITIIIMDIIMGSSIYYYGSAFWIYLVADLDQLQ